MSGSNSQLWVQVKIFTFPWKWAGFEDAVIENRVFWHLTTERVVLSWGLQGSVQVYSPRNFYHSTSASDLSSRDWPQLDESSRDLGDFSLMQHDASKDLTGKSRLMTVLLAPRCKARNKYQCTTQFERKSLAVYKFPATEFVLPFRCQKKAHHDWSREMRWQLLCKIAVW